MKKIISIFITTLMMLSLACPFAFAERNEFTITDSSFVDVSEYCTREHAIARFVKTIGIDCFQADAKILDKFTDRSKISFNYVDEISGAVSAGLVSGYEDDTLRPQAPITRAEALVMLNRALRETELPERYNIEFEDSPAWANRAINRLAAAGIVKGYGDGYVGAYDFLTEEQVNSLCDRISKIAGPAGNFYDYVNAGWLNSVTLKDGQYIYSETERLTQNISNELSDIIFSLYHRKYNDGETFPENSNEDKIIQVYSAAANQGFREKVGLSPVKEFLDDIDSARTVDAVIEVMAKLEQNGFDTMLPFGLDINIYDSSEYIVSVSDCYLGIDKIFAEGKEPEKYYDVYKEYIEKLFIISGETKETAEKSAEAVAELCHTLALTKNSRDNQGALTAGATVCDMKKLSALYSNIDVKKYLENLGYKRVPKAMVYDWSGAVAANRLLTEENLSAIKAYLKASVLDSSALYLTTDMFNAYGEYQYRMFGDMNGAIPSDYAPAIVQELLGWELGEIYVKQYFSETSKKEVKDMVSEIISSYEKLIIGCTRMTPQTRNRVIKKLKSMKINSAYPDNFEDYTWGDAALRPTARGGNLMEYKTLYNRSYHNHCIYLYENKARANRGKWVMYPQAVNAMYDPVSNTITIPAGILQEPFYDVHATKEENLGGIGAVIAHEISHAFDARGSQFDENGNLSDWWTEDDRNGFELLCKKIKTEYGTILVGDDFINGEITLNENLADIAGMSCIIRLAKADTLNLDAVFKSYAKSWRTKTTEEYQKFLIQADVHSPARVRVNRVLSNFREFEELYNILDGDGMYIPDENKIDIWK